MTDADLQHRLHLAHQTRRAKEHQLDDIRRAMCDAGWINDDDPYGHADLADVIRQRGGAETEKPAGDVCGHPGHPADPCQPCVLPLGHDWHRDDDGCSWPAPSGPLLDRKAIRNVLLYVSGCVYSMHRDYVEELSDRLFALYCGPAPDQAQPDPAAVCPDLPGHETHSPPCGKTTLPLTPAGPTPCSINHDCPGQVRPRAGELDPMAVQDRIEAALRDTRDRWLSDGDPVYIAALVSDALTAIRRG